MLFASITFWTLVFSAASALRNCEDCVELTKCPQANEQVKNNYSKLIIKLTNAKCSSSWVLKICCSDFIDDESEEIKDTNQNEKIENTDESEKIGSTDESEKIGSTDESEKIGSTDEIENHQNLHLLSDDCGTRRQIKVIGGKSAEPYEFPWLVLLARNVGGRIKLYCGGTLINSRYVLTAAHCLNSYEVVKVRVGEHDKSKIRACFGHGELRTCELQVQDIRVQEKIIHPNYLKIKSRLPVNDIGLLRLERPVNLTALNTGLICLPVARNLRERNLPGNFAIVAGWGWTEENANQLSDVVQKAEVPISSPDTCSYLYLSNRLGGDELFENVICADESGVGTCKGDSGGPLMVEEEDGFRYVQYGIVSYGSGCGNGIPSLYTDVTKYMKWILDTIKP